MSENISTFAPAKEKPSGFSLQYKVSWMSGLVSGLQNQLERFDSATHLKERVLDSSGTLFSFTHHPLTLYTLHSTPYTLHSTLYTLHSTLYTLNTIMTLFLTSSPTLGWGGDLNPANGFLDELRKALPDTLRCVMITSAPDDEEMTDRMAWEMREIFEHEGLPFDHYEVLDRRTQRYAARMIREANFIILCGGHVPTQNRFFRDINLSEKLKRYDGVIMSISAGSMNCADVVYASPELNGETTDVNYMRFMTGLGLTPINIMPHYQMAAGITLDGLPMWQILNTDSFGRPIYCLPDGSYFKINRLHAYLYGEAYLIRYGVKLQICKNDESKIIY